MSSIMSRRASTVNSGRAEPAKSVARVPRALLWSLPVTALLIYALISLYPFIFMISAAFKGDREVFTNQSLIPRHPTLSALTSTWSQLHFGTYAINSCILAGTTVIFILAVFPLAAYAFAALRFPFRATLYGLFIAELFVPGVTALLPVVILDQKFGLLNTPWAIVLPITNGAGPLAISLAWAFFKTIPNELRESAKIDGASEWRIYWTLYFPLARPALVTISLLNFVGVWNEYVLPSVTTSDASRYPLPVGLQNLLASNVVNWNKVMAGSLIIVLPIIVLFVILQRQFVNSLQGAVKG